LISPTSGSWRPGTPKLLRQIALDDLHVIEVHLHREVRRADLFADGVRLGLRREEISGDIARIDRLDRERDALLRGFPRRQAQVAHERRALARAPLGVPAVGNKPCHDMHAGTLEGVRIGKRSDDAGGELVLAAGLRCKPAIACVAIAGRGVDQDLLEPAGLQLRG
jgi:hypothetical protein